MAFSASGYPAFQYVKRNMPVFSDSLICSSAKSPSPPFPMDLAVFSSIPSTLHRSFQAAPSTASAEPKRPTRLRRRMGPTPGTDERRNRWNKSFMIRTRKFFGGQAQQPLNVFTRNAGQDDGFLSADPRRKPLPLLFRKQVRF
jgi:hypothetical protein